MKRLILMRHAKTEPWTEGIDDHGRALTEIGRKAASAIAIAMAEEGWLPDKVIVSSSRRTRETWACMRDVFPKCTAIVDEALYLAGERGIMDLISDHDGTANLMILGHNPGLHDLSVRLLREAGSADHQAALRLSSKLPTAAAALFESDEDGAFLPVHFRLQNFIRAKDLAL